MQSKATGLRIWYDRWTFKRISHYHQRQGKNMQASGFYFQLSLKKNSHRCFLRLCILLALLFSGCSTPKLNRPFLPQGYQLDSVSGVEAIESPPTLSLLRLNHRDRLRQQVLSNWTKGLLNEAFIRVQPLSTVFSEDIVNLSTFLDRLFVLYLAAMDSKEPVAQKQLRQVLLNQFQCDPLTNLEIRFLMNSGSSTPFSRKPLTMLLISTHELSLLSGAKPIYPKVFSPYLRHKLSLPKLNPPENINLFATKNENRLYSTSISGFIICNRRTQSDSPKP